MWNVVLNVDWFVCLQMERNVLILKYEFFANAVSPIFYLYLKTHLNLSEIRDKTTSLPETFTTQPSPTTESCDVASPNKEDPQSCQSFYQCETGLNGVSWIKKNCGPGTFYNPQTQVCDFEAKVIEIKPSCKNFGN